MKSAYICMYKYTHTHIYIYIYLHASKSVLSAPRADHEGATALGVALQFNTLLTILECVQI